ncbi:hypothetical protein I3760_12G030700 [Carya illinoinensis]|nr:hypothetical protein I3760_12G030700 [Carya illinoinensis]
MTWSQLRLRACSKFSTCKGLQLLIHHFATCKKRVNDSCLRCKRLWQLLRLHSSICDRPDSCRVPLCRQFKLRMQQEKKEDDARWKLLARKVSRAKIILSLISAPLEKLGASRNPELWGVRSFRLYN